MKIETGIGVITTDCDNVQLQILLDAFKEHVEVNGPLLTLKLLTT